MSRTQQRRALGVLAACAALALTGCSGDEAPASVTPPATATAASPTPTVTTATPTATTSVEPAPSATAQERPTVGEVYRDARTASLSAGSGRAAGTQTRDGRTLRIDVEGVANGSNQKVLITTPSGGTSEVITVGTRYWLGGDEAFWVEQTGDPRAGADMVGKYVEIGESDATELGAFTLRGILTEKFGLPEFAALEASSSRAATASVKGRAAYVLDGRSGARLWVAADGSGALLRAVGPKSAPSDLTFTGWERAKTFRQPPADRIVEG